MSRNRVPLAVAVVGLLAACDAVAQPLALVAVAALLFAWLLRRAGLPNPVVAGIVALHVLLLGLALPLPAPLAGLVCFASGSCAYAALVVRRARVRLAVLAVAHAMVVVLCAQASPLAAAVFGTVLAALTGLFLAVGEEGLRAGPPNLTPQQPPPAAACLVGSNADQAGGSAEPGREAGRAGAGP